jgi:hypothetical protein
MRAEIDRLRQVVLAADPRITETIKWGGPTDLATILLRGRSALMLFL